MAPTLGFRPIPKYNRHLPMESPIIAACWLNTREAKDVTGEGGIGTQFETNAGIAMRDF
jgi:hypothetical protein